MLNNFVLVFLSDNIITSISRISFNDVRRIESYHLIIVNISKKNVFIWNYD